MSVVLSITSQVVRGHVGNRAAAPALASLGHELWPLTTVMLAHHPGHDRAVPRLVTPASTIAAFAASLERQGWLGEVDAVLIGYVAEAAQAGAIAEAVGRVRAARSDAVIALDPILGDEGRLYVSEEVADAVRQTLLPLCDMAMPNAFELGWLAGTEISSAEAAAAAARGLGPSEVLVTSAPGGPAESVRTLAVNADGAFTADVPRVETTVHGAGDLMAALYLGRRLRGEAADGAMARAVGAVHGVLEETRRAGRDELTFGSAGGQLANPTLSVATSRIDGPTGG